MLISAKISTVFVRTIRQVVKCYEQKMVEIAEYGLSDYSNNNFIKDKRADYWLQKRLILNIFDDKLFFLTTADLLLA